MSRATVVALAVCLTVALAITLLSANTFFLARGSDAGVQICALPLSTKLLTLLVVAAGWAASVVASRLRAWTRWTLRVAGTGALVLSTHIVSLNFERGELEDHWVLVRWDRAGFDVANGLAQDWMVEPVVFGYRLVHRSSHTTRFIFSGIPPWTLDLAPILAPETTPQ